MRKRTDERSARKVRRALASGGVEVFPESVLEDGDLAWQDGRDGAGAGDVQGAARELGRTVLAALEESRGDLPHVQNRELADVARKLSLTLGLLLGRLELEPEEADAVRVARTALAFIGAGWAQFNAYSSVGRNAPTRAALARARTAIDGPPLDQRREWMVAAFEASRLSDDVPGQLLLRLSFVDPRFGKLTVEQVRRALTRGGSLTEAGRALRKNVDAARVLGQLAEIAGVDTAAAFKKALSPRRRAKK